MSRLVVFASAFSRLHADLMIVRLKRAGISTAHLSVIHPVHCCPNSTLCWLGGSTRLRVSSGENIAASGFLSESLQTPANVATSDATFTGKLEQLGLAHEQGLILEETMLENRVAIAIEVMEKSELATILQVLQRAGGEKIFTCRIDPSDAPRENRVQRPATRIALSVAA
ncbi:MAG TPA: hypothetical protein VHO24_08700 [Opitutaceae bacterium]|nr:hypothetical protein [Opitutaceae bacterium]